MPAAGRSRATARWAARDRGRLRAPRAPSCQALHRNPTPASATATPATRSASCPPASGGSGRRRCPARAGSRSRPRSRCCRRARSAPAGSSVPCAWPWKIGEERRPAPPRPKRRPRLGGTISAEQHRRERDADLDAGQRHAEEPEHAAERHHHRERHRQQPHRRRAELRAPQADRDHREHVVEPGERMAKTGEEAARLPALSCAPAPRRQRRTSARTSEARATTAWPRRGLIAGLAEAAMSVRWIVQKAPSDPTA